MEGKCVNSFNMSYECLWFNLYNITTNIDDGKLKTVQDI